MLQRNIPTKMITIIAYVVAVICFVIFGFILHNSVLAVFLASCVLVLRGAFSCIKQEERHLIFAIVEGFALFSIIRILPVFFSL